MNKTLTIVILMLVRPVSILYPVSDQALRTPRRSKTVIFGANLEESLTQYDREYLEYSINVQ